MFLTMFFKMQNIGQTMQNIDVNVFDDVLQNAKHWANDASNDVNRPPLPSVPRILKNVAFHF